MAAWPANTSNSTKSQILNRSDFNEDMGFVEEEKIPSFISLQNVHLLVPKSNLHLSSIKIHSGPCFKEVTLLLKVSMGFCLQACTHSKCLQRSDEGIGNPGTGVIDDCKLPRGCLT